MKILVTGAGGFVGGAFARLAARAGHQVIGTVRTAPEKSGDVEHVAIDLHDHAAVASLVRRFAPETIVNVAWSNVADRANFAPAVAMADIGTALTLVTAGAAVGLKRFVGLGSQAEYGGIHGRTPETRLPEPTTRYGAAKLAALQLTRQSCAEHGISFAWIRLFSTYGPGDRSTWLIPSVVADLCAGRVPRVSSGAQLWDYLYIDDAASALLALSTHADAAGVFNLGSGSAIAIRTIVEMIRDKVAPGLSLTFGQVSHRSDQIWHMEADITRLCSTTGWTPHVSLSDGLDRTIAVIQSAVGELNESKLPSGEQ